MSELPPGFVLDQPDNALPPGFVLDTEGPKKVYINGSDSDVSTAGDVAKSAGIGLVQGALGTLGAVPGIAGAIKGAANKYLFDPILNATIGAPAVNPDAQGAPDINAMFNPQGLQRGIESVTGKFYEPQTTAGKYARTIGEFAPAALGGEASLLGRVANVAGPAIASETAGQATEGTALEPWARGLGAIAGAGGVAGVQSALESRMLNNSLNRAAAAAVPSSEDLMKTAGKQFKSANDMGVVVTGNVAQDIADSMRANLRKDGFSPNGQKPVFDAIDELGRLGQAPAVAMNDIETVRKQLTKLKMSPDGAVREASKRAIDDLNAGKSSLDPSFVVRGNADDYNKLVKDAVGNYAAGKRGQTLEGKRNLAELNSNSPVGMLDAASSSEALQRTMKQLARPAYNTNVPIAKKLGFNEEEISGIKGIANGNKAIDVANAVDRLAPAKLGAIPSAIIRYFGGLSVQKQVSALDSLVRSRSPLALEVASGLPPEVVERLPARTQRLLKVASAAGRPQVASPVPVMGQSPGQ